MAVTPDLTGITIFKIPHLISHIAARPFAQPFAIIRIPPQAGGNLQSPDYPPCFLGSLARVRTHRPIDAKHLLRRTLARTSFLHFSSPPRRSSLAIPETQEVLELVSLRCFSSLPLLRRTPVDLPSFRIHNSQWGSGVSTELPNGRRTRNRNEKRTGSSTRLNDDQPRMREKEGAGRNAQRDSVRVMDASLSIL